MLHLHSAALLTPQPASRGRGCASACKRSCARSAFRSRARARCCCAAAAAAEVQQPINAVLHAKSGGRGTGRGTTPGGALWPLWAARPEPRVQQPPLARALPRWAPGQAREPTPAPVQPLPKHRRSTTISQILCCCCAAAAAVLQHAWARKSGRTRGAPRSICVCVCACSCPGTPRPPPPPPSRRGVRASTLAPRRARLQRRAALPLLVEAQRIALLPKGSPEPPQGDLAKNALDLGRRAVRMSERRGGRDQASEFVE